MAYRRKQQGTSLSGSGWKPNYNKDSLEEVEVEVDVNEEEPSSTFLVAKAIRASSASQRYSSLSSAYGFSHRSPPPTPTISAASSSSYSGSSISASKPSTSIPTSSFSSSFSKDSRKYEYTSVKSVNEPKQQGFWGSLARKAKSFLDDDNGPDQVDSPGKNRQQVPELSGKAKYPSSYASNEGHQKTDGPKFQKGLNAISSSLNYIGNAVEEGLTIVENRTADIIQETRKNIQKKPTGSAGQNQGSNSGNAWQQTQMSTQKQLQTQTDLELQLKASRDVAMAMAAKAKLLLRELKTVKADLAFAKERCAQLEDENRILRENCERGSNLEDDDMIRLQLETLLAEKARLAHENSVYARENRFLREVVEYHQLTMQDVVYFDESTEEVTEVYPIKVTSNTQPIPLTSLDVSLPSESLNGTNFVTTEDIPYPVRPPGLIDVSEGASPATSYTIKTVVDLKKQSNASI